jgi:hypothetical protein
LVAVVAEVNSATDAWLIPMVAVAELVPGAAALTDSPEDVAEVVPVDREKSLSSSLVTMAVVLLVSSAGAVLGNTRYTTNGPFVPDTVAACAADGLAATKPKATAIAATPRASRARPPCGASCATIDM